LPSRTGRKYLVITGTMARLRGALLAVLPLAIVSGLLSA